MSSDAGVGILPLAFALRAETRLRTERILHRDGECDEFFAPNRRLSCTHNLSVYRKGER